MLEVISWGTLTKLRSFPGSFLLFIYKWGNSNTYFKRFLGILSERTYLKDDARLQIIYYVPRHTKSVGNRSRHSSRLSGLQHLPSVVERATLIAHADMYYSTPNHQCIVLSCPTLAKGMRIYTSRGHQQLPHP